MDSWGGLAAVALFVAWLAYYVPGRVSARQQVADARTDDRFSGGLRVLAVAGGNQATAQTAAVAPALVSSVRVRELVAMGDTVDTHDSHDSADTHDTAGTHDTADTHDTAGTADGPTEPGDPHPHEEGEDMPQDAPLTGSLRRVPAPATGSALLPGAVPPVGRASSVPPSNPPASPRVVARRRAAARRRLLLTLALVLLTVVMVVGASVGAVGWTGVAVPVVLLAVVLTLGRRAVVAGRRAEAARFEAARQRAVEQRRAALGAPPVPRGERRRVTGHAVRTSSSATQMIPRVTAADLERAARRATLRPATGAVPVAAPAPVAQPAAALPAATLSVPAARPDGGGVPDVGADATFASPTEGSAWAPVPVPPPTYALKAPARRAAAAVDDETAPEPESLPAPVPAADIEALAAPGTVSAGVLPADGWAAPQPTTDTLGLSLDAILARRRAVGE